jgi:hypothetical protein
MEAGFNRFEHTGYTSAIGPAIRRTNDRDVIRDPFPVYLSR